MRLVDCDIPSNDWTLDSRGLICPCKKAWLAELQHTELTLAEDVGSTGGQRPAVEGILQQMSCCSTYDITKDRNVRIGELRATVTRLEHYIKELSCYKEIIKRIQECVAREKGTSAIEPTHGSVTSKDHENEECKL